MPEQLLNTGRQLSAPAELRESLVTSAVFRLWCVEGTADFSELGGITSEVEHTEYMEAGPIGAMFSRHPGRSKPPVITLKRAMRTGVSNAWLWTWHQSARQSLPTMYRDCSLTIFGPEDDPSGTGRMTYLLMNAMPTKLEMTGMKTGATEVIVQTLTLQCDELVDPNVV